RDFPNHQAARSGETPEAWTQRNHELRDKALAGDDRAFFDLLSRDPREIASDLAVAKLINWRTELDYSGAYLKLKGSKAVPVPGLREAKQRVDAAKWNLRRLGQIHIRAYDQRGRRSLPPAGP